MEALKELSRLAGERNRQRYPNVPEFVFISPRYHDKSTNALTHSIIDYLRLKGFYAVRINTTGIYNEKLQQWVKGSTTKGTADIHACMKGFHLSIEIKTGKDIQSYEQKETQKNVEKAGGYYFIARNFQNFYEWINNLLTTKQ